MVIHVLRTQVFHYTESIPTDAKNFGLDSYRSMNKIDLRGVTVFARANPGYIPGEEMKAARNNMDDENKDLKVQFSEAAGTLISTIKTGSHEFGAGIKDAIHDIRGTIRGNKPFPTTAAVGGGDDHGAGGVASGATTTNGGGGGGGGGEETGTDAEYVDFLMQSGSIIALAAMMDAADKE
jgi:hypothetical protein